MFPWDEGFWLIRTAAVWILNVLQRYVWRRLGSLLGTVGGNGNLKGGAKRGVWVFGGAPLHKTVEPQPHPLSFISQPWGEWLCSAVCSPPLPSSTPTTEPKAMGLLDHGLETLKLWANKLFLLIIWLSQLLVIVTGSWRKYSPSVILDDPSGVMADDSQSEDVWAPVLPFSGHQKMS